MCVHVISLGDFSHSLSQKKFVKWQLQQVNHLRIITHQPLHLNPLPSVIHHLITHTFNQYSLVWPSFWELRSECHFYNSLFLSVTFYSPQSLLILKKTLAHLHCKLPIVLKLLLSSPLYNETPCTRVTVNV